MSVIYHHSVPEIARKLGGNGTPGANGFYLCCCPAHDDSSPSFGIKEPSKDGNWPPMSCQKSCSREQLRSALVQRGWISHIRHAQDQFLEAEHNYTDERGNFIRQVRKFRKPDGKKSFYQRHKDENGNWVNGGGDHKGDLLFHEPQLKQAIAAQQLILVVEGEKDVLTAERFGLAATTNLGGALKWRDGHTQKLLGCVCALIVPDNDDTGEKHLHQVAASCYRAGIKVHILRLPGLSSKGDLSDWVAQGRTEDELHDLIAEAPAWIPPPQLSEISEADRPLNGPINPTHLDSSEDEIACRFSDLHSVNFLYVEGNWYHWTGIVWKKERTGLVYDLIRKICKNRAVGMANEERRKILKAAFVAGVERLVRVDRQHAALNEQFDQNPYLLGNPSNVIDLKSGMPQAHDPNLLMTKMARVAPEVIDTPIFDAFLKRVQPDEEIRAYLMRRAGYALTGDVRESVLFFDYGTGANGKTVFQTVQLEIMGDYALTAPAELLTESKFDRHSTELARLHGARGVWSSETSANQRWNESKVKLLTGGTDKITARFMRQDDFTYQPQLKLFVVGNHLPKLRNIDEAMRRRLQIVHWGVTIPASERDKSLLDKLRIEYPGILAKFVQGCLEWQRIGLSAPASVDAMTQGYLSDEDTIQRWLDECTTSRSAAITSIRWLFENWQKWCQSRNEFEGTATSLSKTLEERGFIRLRSSGARSFQGLELLEAPVRVL